MRGQPENPAGTFSGCLNLPYYSAAPPATDLKYKENLVKYLLAIIAAVAAIAITAFSLSGYLIRIQIRAAQNDVRLLRPDPVPPEAVSGMDALWLLEYRMADDSERREAMRRYGSSIQDDNPPPELAAARIPVPQESELGCGKNAAECLAIVRAKLPEYRAAATKYANVAANLDHLADYPAFAPGGWSNDEDDLSAIRLPQMRHLLKQPAALAAYEWADGKPQAAWRRVCRNIKTGRALLASRGGMIVPMVGNTVVRHNTELAAQMLHEQPEAVFRLPEECGGVFDVLPEQQQSLCAAIKDEFHGMENLYRKLARSPEGAAEMAAFAASSETPPLFDAEHTAARVAPRYAQACTEAATQSIRRDQKTDWHMEQPQGARAAIACLRNGIGCILDDFTPEFAVYQYRIQDTAMQQRAFQAALSLYRLPAAERRAALQNTLAQHSSPARRPRCDEKPNAIAFDAYFSKEAPAAIPVKLD